MLLNKVLPYVKGSGWAPSNIIDLDYLVYHCLVDFV